MTLAIDDIEPLPADVVSTQLTARDQVIACIDRFMSNHNDSRTLGHVGRVTLRHLKEQGKGSGVRSIISILGGQSSRISGGAATQWMVLWGWFIVIPGTLRDRSADAASITGEAIRFVEFSPWSKLAAGASRGVGRFTGSPGAVIPLGQQLARNNGLLYATTAAGLIDGDGIADVDVAASEVGNAYDAADGAVLALAAPPVGVDSTARFPGGLRFGTDAAAFAKTPRAGSVQLVPLYTDDDESLGSSFWLIRWDQEIGLGTAQRPSLIPPDVLTTVYGFSTIPSTPNDHEFTQVVTSA